MVGFNRASVFGAIVSLCMTATSMFGPAAAEGAVKIERIEYKLGERVFEGVLAYDDAVKDARPGVLVCHEWWGNNAYAAKRATMLAELGYVAFALDMYGKGKITTDPKQAGEWAGELMADTSTMRSIAAKGLSILAKSDRVDPSRLASIGYCMGGTVSLELARSGLDHTQHLKAIVPFHAGTLLAKNEADNANIKGAVAIMHGHDDKFIPEGDLEKFHGQMKQAGIDYAVHSFGNAVHSFTNPDADSFKIPGVKYNKQADERSWGSMLKLFEEVFAKAQPKIEAKEAQPAEPVDRKAPGK